MIEEISGDLLKADADALVNTVNTVGVMGKGIALQFKQAFPANYEAYRRACQRGEVELGRMFVFPTGQLRPRFIINFPTKQHWRSRSRLADIEVGLADLVRVIRERGIASLAVPPLGVGNGGLPWVQVRPLIHEALGHLPEVNVLLYAPSGAPAPEEMQVATKRPTMTPSRATLVGILDRYIEPGFGVSVLEIQKLVYFLQAAGEPLRLDFAPARYGPYAESLNHVLQNVEGHYLRGYGDRSRRVAEGPPLELLPGAADEARAFLGDHPGTRDRLDRVAGLIEGFDTPYGLELLATVHWVATRLDPAAATDPEVTVKRVQAWSPRKGRLFTEQHIKLAWERLRDHGWLTPEPRAAVG
ncbi:MAG TPA: macro domain-containing protein [Actinomycetes bacterium]|nr:macro domain-containing protein [Actinomycetes bacterium]